jgi:ribonuclease PH
MRTDRSFDALRPIRITPGFISGRDASYLIEAGNTRVLCNATIESKVPDWLAGKGKGWITAEYSLLPCSTSTRVRRERNGVSGRTQEIQRLIGRSLRAVANLEQMGEVSVIIDCDVLEADGGTRTASVTGAFLALATALQKCKLEGMISGQVLSQYVSAISVGLLAKQPLLDLCYVEDLNAEVDMNVVMAMDSCRFIEIQGTGEESTYSRKEFNSMLDLAEKGISEIYHLQKSLITELP